MPDLNLSFFPLIAKKFKLGITAFGNYHDINRSFDYQLTTYSWTIEDVIEKQKLNGARNHFRNFEGNIGIVCQF
jgi:hypothetical protein